MNKETQSFVTELLLKYNTHKVVDEDTILFNNISTFKLKDGSVIELECVDAFALISELCEALDITEESVAIMPNGLYDTYSELVKEGE